MDFIIKKIDIFGKPFNFNINKQEQYLTCFGGLLSILVYLAFVISTWYFGQDIYKRQSPKILHKTKQLPKVPYVNLTTTNFFFSLRIAYLKKTITKTQVTLIII